MTIRWNVVGALFGALACVFARGVTAATAAPGNVEIGTGERLLVVAPHPDDETLAAGGVMQRVLAKGGSVRVVLMTAGDGYVEAVAHETGLPRPRPAQYIAYGERRLRELRAAMRVFGGAAARLQFLGFPDGGLDGLLRAHWSRSYPERSATTGATDPPYDTEAVEPDVPYDGADLRREVGVLLREAQPTIVVLPDPIDRHPDHHAAGIFTLLAIKDCTAGATPTRVPMPRLLAYLVHWPDWPPGWEGKTPLPQASTAALELPPNLPTRGLTRVRMVLTDPEVSTKQAALMRYTSQREVIGPLLDAFIRRTEPFSVMTAGGAEHVEEMMQRWRAHRPTPPRD